MPFAYLLKTKENVASFKASFNIPRDVEILYCDKGDIEDQRRPYVVFFPLMSILEGGARFLVNPLLLKTLSFYGLSLDQCLPNFYKVVSCVGQLKHLYGLSLTHHDINFMYSIQGSLNLEYYLQTRSTMVWLISKKFQLDISFVRVKELNFILHSNIFVHFNGQLKASHLILGCVPSYTSY